MSERERTDPDPIEFDFFDDSPTSEALREPAPPKRRRRLPTRPPGGGGSPVVRQAAFVVGAILLLVVLVLWVKGCRDDAKTAEYERYMDSVSRIGGESAEIGGRLNQLIFSAGIQVEQLQADLEGLRQAQTQTVRRAEELDAPGPLREQQESLVEALQLRVSGLNGLASAFTTIDDAGGSTAAAELLAEQSNRLLASDVVYADFFRVRAQEVMDAQGVTGVAVPDSRFVSNAELSSPASWTLIYDRLTKPPTAGGLHGNRIAGVRALPGPKELSSDEETTVTASDNLAFEVLVENSGDNQETQVKVTLTIQQSPEPIRMEQTIDAINPDDTKIVTFEPDQAPQFGPRLILKVTVDPVAGEQNTNNNTAEYPVVFTIG